MVPSSASEVLVLASILVASSGPSPHAHYVKIYTEQDQRHYEKYILLVSYNQNAWNTNSDNLWFPMTSGRQVFVESTVAHNGTIGIHLHAIGYR